MVSAGTGTVTFGNAVGGTTALASLAVTGPTTLDGSVTTTGTQTYNSAVTLGGTDTLTTTANGSVDFATTVDGDYALTVSVAGTGTVTFNEAVGANQALASLAVTGPTQIGSAEISTVGPQTYNSAVSLTNITNLFTVDSAVDFASTVDSPDFGSLTVNAGSGTVTFDGAVGGIGPLATLEVNGPTTLDANVTTSLTQTYTSAVTLGSTDHADLERREPAGRSTSSAR